MQKNLALIAKYFKKLYKPTNNNLRNDIKHQKQNVDTTPRLQNDNQTEDSMGIRGAMNEFWSFYEGIAGSQNRLKTPTLSQEKMCSVKKAEKGAFTFQAQQSDWQATTDERLDKQELKPLPANGKDPEVPNAELKALT
ncbi:hypothetical protein Tco_0940743 [Tanacetum coccineum]|uniref:Uncharacterized protein n=1 Tax=Tanacetum coccineum TaxID=301880 RepID=A0ABQ5DQK8_9ASTR